MPQTAKHFKSYSFFILKIKSIIQLFINFHKHTFFKNAKVNLNNCPIYIFKSAYNKLTHIYNTILYYYTKNSLNKKF